MGVLHVSDPCLRACDELQTRALPSHFRNCSKTADTEWKELMSKRNSRIYCTAMTSLTALAILSFMTVRASASYPTDGYGSFTSVAAAPNGGFWIQLDGNSNSSTTGTYAIDGAPQFESVQARGSIAAIPGREGYWIVSTTGQIYARGDAPELCGGQLSSCSGYPSNPGSGSRILAAAATPDGKGLWALTADHKVWTAGSAQSYGDVTHDNRTPTGIVGTPSGRGYYIVSQDGGVFVFGDAVFYGSTGGNKPGGHNVTGIALSLTLQGEVDGYWLVADDGGVFTFGDAPFLGSSGGNNGGSIVTGIATRPGGRSYAWVHANGGVDLSRTVPSVTIKFANRGALMGVPGSSKAPATPLQLMEPDGSTSQRWNLWPTTHDGKVVQLVNVNSNLCADVTKNARGALILIQYTCKGSTQGWDNQRFTLVTGLNGFTDFEPKNNPGWRVGAMGPLPGSALILQPFNYDPYALWILTPTPSSGNEQPPEP
jgi:hypothetical protein